jgi:hypothetical protein
MNPRDYAESDPYKSDEIFKRLKVGVSFTYLGIEMIVTRQVAFTPSLYIPCFPCSLDAPATLPELHCEYKDNNGVLITKVFERDQLRSLLT